jgi:hypothetical protein
MNETCILRPSYSIIECIMKEITSAESIRVPCEVRYGHVTLQQEDPERGTMMPTTDGTITVWDEGSVARLFWHFQA